MPLFRPILQGIFPSASALFLQQSCSITNKDLLKPRPRSYRRRLFEAVLKPIVPIRRIPQSQRCSHREERQKVFLEDLRRLNPIQLAQIRHIRKEFRDTGMIAVCQGFYYERRTVLIQRGIMRVDGLRVQTYSNAVMKGVVQNTKFASLDPLFVGFNYVVFAEGMEYLPVLVKHVKKFPWLTLLGVGVHDRILTAEEAEFIAGVESIDSLRSETVSLLGRATNELPQLLNRHFGDLTRNLDSLAASQRQQQEREESIPASTVHK